MYILQESTEPVQRHLDKFSTVVDIQFGTVSLGFGSRSAKNFAQGSVDDSALPPILASTRCSCNANGLMERRYSFGDICNTFEIIEGDNIDKRPSDCAFGVISATGCASTLFSDC